MKRLSALFLTLIAAAAVVAVPFKAAAADVTYIKSETAVLMEANTGTVIYNKNMNKKMYPASITKIMTGLLALENCTLDEMMTASYNSVHSLPYNSSHIALDTGEQISVKDALYALAIESANDVANVFAEHIAGSNEAFGAMMTQRAKQLGANSTNFTNPHGLPEDEHYTTAYDMALITAQAIKKDGFCTYFNTNRYDMGTTNIRSETRSFWNANNFINGYDRVEGLLMSKTGWTEEAMHTLVTVAERNGVTLVAVVMSSEHKQEKFDDTIALFDYGFEKYYNLEINNDIIKGKVNPTVTTHEGVVAEIPAENYIAESFTVTIPKNLTEHDLKYDFSTVVPNSDKTVATGQVEVFYMENGAKISCGTHGFSVMLGEAMVNVQPKKMPLVLKIGLWLLYAALGALVLRLIWLMLRQLVIMENRRRIRERKRKQAMAKRRRNQQTNTTYRKK
ncbi:MAG: D-alanyl-D-alanine carboxypeptidase [Ruminococcaceae bacterium]|nr:D-alanyl-D-alanine carboxypeptidase [Oscillospiraceae bacterium]